MYITGSLKQAERRMKRFLKGNTLDKLESVLEPNQSNRGEKYTIINIPNV